MKKLLQTLYAAADEAVVQGILDELKKKGFRVKNADAPKKGEAVLLFLSAAFAADETLQERFFAADSAGATVVPVDLDGAAQPELVASALMAKNAIAAQDRTTEEIAARVASAEAFAEKGNPKRLGRILLAAALVLVIGAGVWVWRGYAEKRAAEAEQNRILSAAAARIGLQPEDLESIQSFAIIGDTVAYSDMKFSTNSDVNSNGKLFVLRDYAYQAWEEDGAHWYSTKDGHRYEMTRYDDLGFLQYMPNLSSLTLILTDVGTIPSLEGLDKLEMVNLFQCDLPDYAWLAGSHVRILDCENCGCTDFSGLSGCEDLFHAAFNLDGLREADFSAFAPPMLHYFQLENGYQLEKLELSGLGDCSLSGLYINNVNAIRDLSFLGSQNTLIEVELRGLGELRSLSPLENMSGMLTLRLEGLNNLSDISAIGSMTKLKNLAIDNCTRIADYSCIGNCTELKQFYTDNCNNMRDASFLGSIERPNTIGLYDVRVQNLDFLYAIGEHSLYGIDLGFSDIPNVSGLSAVKNYVRLHADMKNADASQIIPYLEGASIQTLDLSNVKNLDLSAMPRVEQSAMLQNCGLESLAGIPNWRIHELRLEDMPELKNLVGIKNLNAFLGMTVRLVVRNCKNLTDWSELRASSVTQLELDDISVLPDLTGVKLESLRLQNIRGIQDLSILDPIPDGTYLKELALLNLDGVRDLSPLRRLHVNYLEISPELQEQAEQLVKDGVVGRYEVIFTEAHWQPYEDEGVSLESFEELSELEESTLANVKRLCIVGDEIVDLGRYELSDYWDNKGQHVVLRDRESSEERMVELGTMTDLSLLEPLTGLRNLEIWCQPLESLEGVQHFGELESLQVQDCPKLKDVSAAFTLQGMRSLNFGNCPVESIQGVQNLHSLHSLGIWGTQIRDLTPLRELDTDEAEHNGGFNLSVGGTNCDDYGPIASIGVFSWLDLNSAEYKRWPDLAEIREIRALTAHNARLDQAALEKLVAAHPELEELQIPYNREITDLTPLLELNNLRYVLVNQQDMAKAIASLQGQSYSFRLEIW